MNQQDHTPQPSGAEDCRWGAPVHGVQIGIWASRTTLEENTHVDLRCAIRNSSDTRAQLENRFGLVIQAGADEIEDFSGPRSSEPVTLESGQVQTILGWRLAAEEGLCPGRNTCFAVYRPEDGEEIRSQSIEIVVRS